MAIAQLAKKGGRYTKKERNERRTKVFQLHFDYGYSARKISQMMNINRDTINRDISFWYSELGNDYDKNGIDQWLNKQLSRLESQRVGLTKELDSDQKGHLHVLYKNLLKRIEKYYEGKGND